MSAIDGERIFALCETLGEGFDLDIPRGGGTIIVRCTAPKCDAAWQVKKHPLSVGARLHLLNHRAGHVARGDA